MVTLSLLRHAKSRWDNKQIDDFDRPLAPRGLRAAPAMGRFMQEQAIVPDLVLCSPARRARQTLDLVLPFFDPRPEIRVEDDLYPAAAEDMLDGIRETPDTYAHVMLVGHNPGLQALCCNLAGSGEADAVAELAQKFPTGGLAVLTFEGSWCEVRPAAGHLRVFMVPRRLAVEAEG